MRRDTSLCVDACDACLSNRANSVKPQLSISFILCFLKTVKECLILERKGIFTRLVPSIRDGVPRSGMLLYLHHRDSKIFFHPAKFDNFKDEKISDFKTVSVSQRKNLLD